MYTIDYWDVKEQRQVTRAATADETTDIDARKAAGPSPEFLDAQIEAELMALDLASIRPLRENDKVKLAALEVKAVALRAKLKKPKA